MPKFVDGETGASVRAKLNTVIDKVEGAATIDNGLTISGDLTVDTNTLHVDSTNNRVGIGTTTPGEKLDVTGNISVSGQGYIGADVDMTGITNIPTLVTAASAPYRSGLTVTSDANTLNWALFELVNRNAGFNGRFSIFQTQTGLVEVLNRASASLTMGTNDTERMRIDSIGRVGIGTTSPTAPLTVIGSQNNTTQAIITGPFGEPDRGLRIATGGVSATNDLAIFDAQHSTGRLAFQTASTERMRIDYNGNVGIGTTSPRSGLHVYGAGQNTANITDAGNQAAFLRVSDSSVAAGGGGGIIFASTHSDDTGAVGMAAIKAVAVNGNDNSIGDLAIATRNAITDTALTERMRIKSNGRVGIGTTNPQAPLDVIGDIRLAPNQRVFTQGGSLSISADANNSAAGSAVNILVDGSELADFIHSGYLRFNKADFASGGICTQSLDSTLNLAGGANPANSGLNIALSGPDHTAGNRGLLMRDGTTVVYNYQRALDAHLWYTDGSERMRVTTGGNVGIGTTNPGSKLSVVGLPTSQTGLSDGDIWLDSGALRTGSPDDAIVLTPESYGADATGASNASTQVSTFLDKCVSLDKMGLMAGDYRLDSAITVSMDGTTPGEHISLLGAGQNMRGIRVNNSTGGIHFSGTGVARQHTVEMRSLHFEPATADSGYPFKVTGTAGGLSAQSGVVIDGVYVGAREETADLDFNEGPSVTGIYRPRINDLRIVQPIDASAVNKWTHCLDISGCFFPTVHDVWINVAQAGGGADIGIDLTGTDEEGGYFSNCVVNGADVGFYYERTGRQPHFQWYGGHINCREVGMQFNGIKYALIDGVLMYSNDVDVGVDYVDFLLEDADGVLIRNCQFRTDGGDKRHFKLEPKSGKTGAVVRNITIYLDQATLFADTAVAPIYCNGATNVTVVIPDEVSTYDFVSYPERLVEMGPAQDVSEVRIITQSGLRKLDNTNAAGPDFILDRISTSPAANDALGRVMFTGKNSAGETTEYVSLEALILDATDGTEDGYIDVVGKVAGSDQQLARFIRPAISGSTGLQIAAREGASTTLEGVQWVDATVNGQAGRFLYLPT